MIYIREDVDVKGKGIKMNIRRLTYTALFIALGIVLPQAFHLLGGPGLGSVFLPMHIPVLMGGILLGPLSGFLIGMISVVVGFLLGMPAMPMAAFMFFELATYGLVAGYLGNRSKLNVYLTMIVSMLSGRLVSLGLMQFAIRVLEIELPPIFGRVAIFATGIPGMILQLVIIPSLVLVLRRFVVHEDSIGTAKNI
jgi:niacin transporter